MLALKISVYASNKTKNYKIKKSKKTKFESVCKQKSADDTDNTLSVF